MARDSQRLAGKQEAMDDCRDVVKIWFTDIDDPGKKVSLERPKIPVYITGWEYGHSKGHLDVIVKFQPASED
jgi:hypothetical protein